MALKAVPNIVLMEIPTVNRVPFPTALSTVTLPSNASVSFLTTAKPKPCPLDLVVNNGLKSFSFTQSGMPSPVSAMLLMGNEQMLALANLNQTLLSGNVFISQKQLRL